MACSLPSPRPYFCQSRDSIVSHGAARRALELRVAGKGGCGPLASRAWKAYHLRCRTVPRMGVFWAVSKRSRVRATTENSPLFLEEMPALCVGGQSGSARLRRAVARDDLPFACFAQGLAGRPRAVSSKSTALFDVRRGSVVAALNVSDGCVDSSTGAVDI